MNESMWLDLMGRLGFSPNLDTYNLNTYAKLMSSYGEKHRHYHNMTHIDATLKHLSQAKHLARDYEALEVALCFHDAIYKIFSSSNELDSADWAAEFLKTNNASEEFISKVHRLIMVTLHDASPSDNDESLMVDIDLSILGCSAELYNEFEVWIRKEYSLIPSFIYKKKRKEILTGFLDREKIYSHEYFFERFEASARQNILTAIQRL